MTIKELAQEGHSMRSIAFSLNNGPSPSSVGVSDETIVVGAIGLATGSWLIPAAIAAVGIFVEKGPGGSSEMAIAVVGGKALGALQ